MTTDFFTLESIVISLLKVVAALYLLLLPGRLLTCGRLTTARFDALERLLISILGGICLATLMGFVSLKANSNQLKRDFILAIFSLSLIMLAVPILRAGRQAYLKRPFARDLAMLVFAAALLYFLPTLQGPVVRSSLSLTEFYLIPQSENVDRLQSADIDTILLLGITNHYPQPNQYRIEAYGADARHLKSVNLIVAAGESWQGEIVLPFHDIQATNLVDLMLFLSDQPQPVAELRLWK